MLLPNQSQVGTWKVPFCALPWPPGYWPSLKPRNFTNHPEYRGSSSFLRTEVYQFSALMVLRYTQQRGCSPGTPGSAANTASHCLVSSSSLSIGCAFAHSALALLQSYTTRPNLVACVTLWNPVLLHVYSTVDRIMSHVGFQVGLRTSTVGAGAGGAGGGGAQGEVSPALCGSHAAG